MDDIIYPFERVDPRLRKIDEYEGPKDESFLILTVQRYLYSTRNFSDAVEAFSRQLFEDSDLEISTSSVVTAAVRTYLTKEDLPLSFVETLADICLCLPEESHMDVQSIRQELDKLFEAEFKALKERLKSLKEKPCSCGLVALGDAMALQQYLASKKDIEKPQRRGLFGISRKNKSNSSDKDVIFDHPLLDRGKENYWGGRSSCLILALQSRNKDCTQVIIDAAREAPSDVIKELIGCKDSSHYTAMRYAINNRDMDTLKTLIELGEDITMQSILVDYRRMTPVEYVCYKASEQPILFLSFLESVLQFLECSQNYDVNKPLESATKRRNPFYELGLDTHYEDPLPYDDDDDNEEVDNNSIFDFGTESCRTYNLIDNVAKYKCVEVINILIQHGSKPTGAALMNIIDQNSDGMDDMLAITRGIPGYRRFKYNNSAETYACIKAVIDANPSSTKYKDLRGDTPLHSAIFNENIEIMKLLLKHGANVRTKNNTGISPADLATNASEEVKHVITKSNLLRRLVSTKSQQSKDLEEVPDEITCVACRTRHREVILAPCGHKVLCRRCTKRLLEGQPEMCKCPYCSEEIQSFITKTFQ